MAGSVAPPAFINEVGRPPVQERTAVTPQLSPNIQSNNTTVPERVGASVHTYTNNKRCVNRQSGGSPSPSPSTITWWAVHPFPQPILNRAFTVSPCAFS